MAGPLELVALDLITDLLSKNNSQLRRLARSVDHLKEHMMAEFANLNAALDAQQQELSAAVQRVADDVQSLKDQIAELELDAADQAAVDAATERVNASVEALRAVDPVQPPAGEPAEEPTPGDGETPADPNA